MNKKLLHKISSARMETRADEPEVINHFLKQLCTVAEYDEIVCYLIKRTVTSPGLLHEFFNRQSDASPLEATEQERLEEHFAAFVDSKLH